MYFIKPPHMQAKPNKMINKSLSTLGHSLLSLSHFLPIILILGIGLKVQGAEIASCDEMKPPLFASSSYIDADLPDKDIILSGLNEIQSNSTYHLFSHGRAGELLIDGQWLDAKQIAVFLSDQLNDKRGPRFSSLNIYGCEFAKGEKGKQAVAYLENILNVSIAASEDLTGSNGDWDLEVGSAKENISQFEAYNHTLQFCPELDNVYHPDDDLIITTYHSHIAKTFDAFVVWGEDMQPSGNVDQQTMRTITDTSGYNYSGDVVMFATSGNTGAQAFLLTTDSFYVWGENAEVVGAPAVGGDSFRSMALPSGVGPADVFDIKANSDVLFLITNDGEVYVIGLDVADVSGNASNTANVWHQVETSASVPLDSVIQLTGSREVVYVQRADKSIWAWGDGIALGNGAAPVDRTYASLVDQSNLPTGVTLSQLGTFMRNEGNNTGAEDSGVLGLGSDGKVYGIGYNGEYGKIINDSDTFVTDWFAVQDSHGVDLDNVIFLATSDNSEEMPHISIIREYTGETHRLFVWGYAADFNMGYPLGPGGAGDFYTVEWPSIPNGFTVGVDNPVYTDVGGHATSYYNTIDSGQICFVGHIISGSGAGLQTDPENFNCFNAFTDTTGNWNDSIALCIQEALTDAPIAVDDNVTINGCDSVIIAVLDNDADPNFDSLTVSLLTGTTSGTFTVIGDSTVKYVSAVPFSGVDSIQYQICDSFLCDTAWIRVTVTSNSAPVAVNDIVTTNINVPVTINELSNDSDADNDSLTVTILLQPDDGSASFTGQSILYTPDPGFTGNDTIEYKICDDNCFPLCDSAFIFITVDCVVETPGNNEIYGTVFNDTNTDTIYSAGESGQSGVLVRLYEDVNQDGMVDGGDTLLDTVSTDVNGDFSFSVTLPPSSDTVSVEDVSGGIAINAGTPCSTPITRTITITDSLIITDVDFGFNADHAWRGDIQVTLQSPIGTSVVVMASSGSDSNDDYDLDLDDASGGSINDGNNDNTAPPYYDRTAAPSNALSAFNGENSAGNWTVSICDVFTGADNGTYNRSRLSIIGDELSSDAAYVMEIDQNDLPSGTFMTTDSVETAVFDATDQADCSNNFGFAFTVGPIAVDDVTTTPSNTPVETQPLVNDTAGTFPLDPASIDTIAGEGPFNGTVVVNNDGTIDYTPDPNFAGIDSFKYVICDSLTPTPLCDTATVVITIIAEQPIALDDITTTPVNTLVTTTPLDNDVPGTNPLDPSSVDTIPGEGPVNGTVVVNPDGTIDYTPNPNFSGADSFMYVMCDSTQPVALCDTATVFITIVLTPPTAVDDVTTTPSNTPVNTTPLTNDTPGTFPLDPASIDTISGEGPLNGTVVVNTDGTIDYTPDPNFAGVDSFMYVICDSLTPTPLCDTATVVITILADQPIALDDITTTPTNTPVTTVPLANDVPGTNPLDPGSVGIITGEEPANGSVVVNPNGTIDYTPDPNFAGADSFMYAVCDSTQPVALCDTATVFITIVPTPPVAVDDVTMTPANKLVVTTPLTNDIPGSSPLNPTTVDTIPDEGPANGTVVINVDGTINYGNYIQLGTNFQHFF